MSERIEWGVRHSQGIRPEGSERAAREWQEFSARLWDEKRRTDKGCRPEVVFRRVTDWTAVQPDPTTTPDDEERER